MFGGIIYDEYKDFTGLSWALYIVGVLIMFCGILVAVRRLGKLEEMQRLRAEEGLQLRANLNADD